MDFVDKLGRKNQSFFDGKNLEGRSVGTRVYGFSPSMTKYGRSRGWWRKPRITHRHPFSGDGKRNEDDRKARAVDEDCKKGDVYKVYLKIILISEHVGV